MARKHKLLPKKKAKQNNQKLKKIKKVQKKKEKVGNVVKSPLNNKIKTKYDQLDPNAMKVKALQHELGLRGLNIKGNKKELQFRLSLQLETEKRIDLKKSSGIRKSTRNK